MAYNDLNSTHNPAAGLYPPSAWGDQIRDNDEFLISPPRCSVFNSTTQTIANGISTVLTANSENYDKPSGGMHSTSSNTGRIVSLVSGLYLVYAVVQFAGFAGNNTRVIVELRTNGTGTILGDTGPNVANVSTDTRHSTTRLIELSAGDYVETLANQNSGGNLAVTLVQFAACFQARL